ncbi:MAG: hypothetical protein IE926_04790 [Micrococcales bacterium]|nr:hypothetical protein [Micrococcales bacterium]
MSEADRIVLVGQAHWVRGLSRGLADVGLAVGSVPLQSIRDALNPTAWRQISRAQVILRVGFRPGAHTWRGRAFDAALALVGRRATPYCYWIGTDVMNLLLDKAADGKTAGWRSPHTAAFHLAGSAPLARELAEVGIDAEIVGFPWKTLEAPSLLPEFPPGLTVLTYVPDARAEFYGGPVIVEAARRLPHVAFRVMGGAGTWCREVPDNVEFLGWVDDPAAAYSCANCVVRMVEHDSIGGTAVEGLLFGRRVLYSQPLEHTVHIERTADSLVNALESAEADARAGRLGPDAEAAEWARREFDHVSRFALLAERLRAAVAQRSDG